MDCSISRRSVVTATALGAVGAFGQLSAASAQPLRQEVTGGAPTPSTVEVTKVISVAASERTLDGMRLPQSVALYTPIWSDADSIFIADSIPDRSWMAVRDAKLKHPRTELGLWRLPKNGSTASYRVIQPADGSNGWEFDGANPGHRGASVTISDQGTVLVHPPLHMLANVSKSSTWANTPLSCFSSLEQHGSAPFTPVPSPAGGRTASSYRRFFRDPITGTTYLLVRGTDYQALLYTWDESRRIFQPVHRATTRYDTSKAGSYGLNDGLSSHPSDGQQVGAYGHEIAFSAGAIAGSSIMYCATEFRVNKDVEQSGFPRRDIGFARSTDGGTTWRNPQDDSEITELFRPTTADGRATNVLPIFEGPAYETAGDDANHDSVGARIGVTGEGRVVVVATWARRPADASDTGRALGAPERADYRSLWRAVWDPATKTTTRTCLYNPGSKDAAGTWSSDHHAGLPSIVTALDGTLVIVASTHDDHDHRAGRENYGLISDDGRSTSFSADAALHIYVTKDGRDWTDSTVGPGTLLTAATVTGTSGAYTDAECLDRDNVVRIYPVFPNAPSRAEVWEIPVPATTVAIRDKHLGRPVLRAESLSTGNNITWDAPPSDAGSAIWQYVLHSADSPEKATSISPDIAVFTPGIVGFVDRNSHTTTGRSYVIFARNNFGTSWASNSVTMTSGHPKVVAAPRNFNPTHWFRASDLDLNDGDPVAEVPVTPGATSPLTLVQTNASRRPAFLANGPAGAPAIRFSRGRKDQLTLASALRFQRTTTVFTVARVRDESYSMLAATADASGALVTRGPFSRTSHSAHETRSAGPGANGTFELTSPDTTQEITHAVATETGIGVWKVYVSQWRIDPDSKLRVSGQINRCASSQVELPADAGRRLSGVDEPMSTQMLIGSASTGSGEVLTSAVDIAEILRFDGSMSRARIQDFVLYLCSRHEINQSNVVDSDLRAAWDTGRDRPLCIDVARSAAAFAAGGTGSALRHASCEKLTPTGSYSPA
ncbi:hypothetical protein [Rathayibacter agropyri]|uniref:hypothetical protein n=1 Tax=Rathayibacter agropyri TaxID=1634927 RepID=UPI0015678209|nr:hypothetical protein [Rathayibacter agropyri]NRD07571.1 hypothetical protein [Rathayibacter agropyri]